MYKRSYITLIIIFTLVTSCSEKEFLDITNPNAVTTSTFWQSEKQFNSALTTVYGALQFQDDQWAVYNNMK